MDEKIHMSILTHKEAIGYEFFLFLLSK